MWWGAEIGLLEGDPAAGVFGFYLSECTVEQFECVLFVVFGGVFLRVILSVDVLDEVTDIAGTIAAEGFANGLLEGTFLGVAGEHVGPGA